MNHVLGFLLLCFTVLGGTSKDDPLERVSASVGLLAILPCRQNIPENTEVPTIEWSKVGLEPPIVFVYRQGVEVYAEKHKTFEFRTHLFMTELHHGNFSMRLSEVRKTDAGEYLCKTLWNKDWHEVVRVELVVVSGTAAGDPSSSRPDEGTEEDVTVRQSEHTGGSEDCTVRMVFAGLGSGLSVLFLVVVGFRIYSKFGEKKEMPRQSSDETTTSNASETRRLLQPENYAIIEMEPNLTEPPDVICSTPNSTISKYDSRNGGLFEAFPDVTDNDAANPVTCEILTASKSVKFLNREEEKRKTLTRQDAHTDDELKSTFSLSKSPNKIMTRSKSLSDSCSVTFEDLKNKSRRHSLSVPRFDTEKLLQKVQEEPETDGPSPKVGRQG